MSMSISTDVHRVKSISVRAGTVSNGSVWTEFTLVTEDCEFTLTAYSKDHLQIVGGDHVNFVASGEEESA